jgi:thiaminase/transcriptional activator TenA
MAEYAFTTEAHEGNRELWHAVLDHPFVQGIGDGTLARDRYEFYLKQDYLYLIEYSRSLALAVAKEESVSEMRRFSSLLSLTLTSEMELHRKTCVSFGIGLQELEQTEPALITTAYTNTILRTCYEGSGGDLFAVLLPCEAGYVEIAEHLSSRGLPEPEHYRSWIETYSSPKMKDVVNWLSDRMNSIASRGQSQDRQRWHNLYRTSVRFELLFFQMAWEMAGWPESVPI